MKPLGIISGTVLLQGKGIFADLREETVETDFGRAVVFRSAAIVFVARHGTRLFDRRPEAPFEAGDARRPG
ncbi:MAG: hypothetical protein NTY86_15860 [Deltaproteobacteria bacterium]|nr:hypothetical protein [Deltaproteobacteria bacterium]